LTRISRQKELHEKSRALHEKIAQRLRMNQVTAAARSERDFNDALDMHELGEETIVAEVNEFLELREADNVRKHAHMYRDWENGVFHRIQTQIDTEVSRRVRKREIGHRWRTAQDEYLAAEHGKDKGLFRDIIIESEYDPLVTAATRVQYSSKGLKDPMKIYFAEEHDPALKPEVPAHSHSHDGRLDVKQWTNLEATPYGHYNKLMSAAPVVEGGNKAVKASMLRSQVSFNHYSYATGRKAIDDEFPKPKRTVPGVRR